MENLVFNSRLYGPIRFDGPFLNLIRSKELLRLHNISLSAIPYWASPTSVNASRLEHSIGVMHLASLLGERPEFQETLNDLLFASLVHDIAMPPFCDVSDHFMKIVLGGDHEELAYERIESSHHLKDIAGQIGTCAEMAQLLITGKGTKFGKLLNGSIDLDNIDNIALYLISKGLVKTVPYFPEKIVQAFMIKDGELCLDVKVREQVFYWLRTRLEAYNYVYSEANLVPGMMIFRALGFAYEGNKLTEDFFLMNDCEALQYLMNWDKMDHRVCNLMNSVTQWRFYNQVFTGEIRNPSQEVSDLLKNPFVRLEIADGIAQAIGFEPYRVCCHIGKHRGYRQIDLPFFDRGKIAKVSEQEDEKVVGIHVYLAMDQRLDYYKQAVSEYLSSHVSSSITTL